MGGPGSDAVGYNCSEIEALSDVINKAAQDSANGITEIIEAHIVEPMSTVWYAVEAVDFFNEFAEEVKSKGESIRIAFDAFRAKVQSAGNEWAAKTKGTAPELSSVPEVELNLDVSKIQPDDGGYVYIREDKATEIANKVSDTKTQVQERVRSVNNMLNAKTSFLGRNQAEAAQECFERVSETVAQIFNFLDGMQGRIDSVADAYGTQAESVHGRFGGSNPE